MEPNQAQESIEHRTRIPITHEFPSSMERLRHSPVALFVRKRTSNTHGAVGMIAQGVVLAQKAFLNTHGAVTHPAHFFQTVQ